MRSVVKPLDFGEPNGAFPSYDTRHSGQISKILTNADESGENATKNKCPRQLILIQIKLRH
jgi:hypothetical protein